MDIQTLLRDYRRAVKDDPAPLLALFAEEAARAEVAERLVTDLEAQLAAQQWRPVTEKPEQPDTYLVYRGGAAHNEPWRYDFAVWEDAWDTEAFSHWRPLPPTPAETTP